MARCAPSAARRFAMAAPMPREPPVTSAIFPSNFCDIVLLLYLRDAESQVQRNLPTISRSMLVRYEFKNVATRPTHRTLTSSDALSHLSSPLGEVFCKLTSNAFGVWQYTRCISSQEVCSV